jgi:phosphatidylserine/phosphatidylglycerophosphate/cardiolipin synthase-like enzyme
MRCEVEILSGSRWWPRLRAHLLAARSSVKVSMYLFSPNWHDKRLDLIGDFKDIARRGCQARIILSAAPLRIGKRRPNIETAQKLLSAGWDVRVIGGRSALHEKIIIVDERATFIGSHNLSYSSATTNLDTSVLLHGPEAAAVATRQFWERWRLAKSAEAHRWELRAPIDLPFEP